MKPLKRFATAFALLLTAVVAAAGTYTIDNVPNVHVQNRTRYVSNPDGIVSSSAQAQLDSIFAEIWNKTSVEAVAVIVDNIDPDDIDTFATELFTFWGIGKADNDNGVLILVVKGEHAAVIRTGYGAEGALPDIVCSRILREQMFPKFKQEDYDGGMIAAAGLVRDILSKPELAEELMSGIANDSSSDDILSDSQLLSILAGWALFMTIVATAYVFYSFRTNRNRDRKTRYAIIQKTSEFTLVATAFGFCIPIIAFLINRRLKSKLRREPIPCSRCGYEMTLLPSQDGQQYLTPIQLTESRIKTVDFDVWNCQHCKNIEIIDYPREKNAMVCPFCGARAEKYSGNEVVLQPTFSSRGKGVHKYTCCHCGKIMTVAFVIPMLVRGFHGGGGRRGGFGGGFSGGSFGGGATGGGGASGRW